MIEVRLFELLIKGDRLDEINAKEVLDRRAAAQKRTQVRRRYLRCLRQQLAAWVGRPRPTPIAPSGVTTK